MPRLSEEQFAACFGPKMQRLSQDEEPPFDFWPYVEAIPPGDFAGHDCSDGTVEWVYRYPAGHLEHVLIRSDTRDVFMVIVIDALNKVVVGHHLLDLPNLYDIRTDGTPGSGYSQM